MSKRTWITFSGIIWLAIGIMLLHKGLSILANGISEAAQDRALWLIGIALLVGFIKGRFVLAKTVRRLTLRIASLDTPIRFLDAYPKSYWLLLGSMMAMGFLLRLVPLEVRGFIDVAIGSALINGAMLFWRSALTLEKAN